MKRPWVALNPKSKIQNPKWIWRRRVGVEPTQARSRVLADGFEDRAHHRTGCASAICGIDL